ncbi:pantoate-beta-alanine ligase [Wolffia australiana]
MKGEEREAMAVIRDKGEMRSWSRSRRKTGARVALVPTMGFLHRGHLALVEDAKRRAEFVVVSVYVNPGQFAPSEDLESYPSDLAGDLRKLDELAVDAVFCPPDLYDYGGYGGVSARREVMAMSCLEDRGRGGAVHETWIRVERLEEGLCGKSRPIFFRGVATVVAKLFNVVEPDVAVFGKKDYQQWRIIRRMVRDLEFDIDIIGAEVVREADGLAMSSRNVLLSPTERQQALSISESLSKAKVAAQNGVISCKGLQASVVELITQAGGRVDYAEIVDQEDLRVVEEIKAPVVFCVAAWFGKVRLIDNIEINP